MRVKDIMTTEPRSCPVDASVAAAAAAMWEADCGFLSLMQKSRSSGS
jgi:hypothetical protein